MQGIEVVERAVGKKMLTFALCFNPLEQDNVKYIAFLYLQMHRYRNNF